MLKFKKLSLSLCLFAISSSVFAVPVLVKSQKNIEEYKLDNGLRVVLAPNAKEDKVYMNVVYFTGALDDPQGKGGLAHLLEHLMFKGTQDVQGEEFQRRLDQHTLMTNAMTSFNYTQYINVMRAEQKNVNELLYLEAQRMAKNVIKMEHVPNEIEIVKREREIRMDQPFSVVRDQLFKELYGNKSLGRTPIGDLDELQSINLNDLQQFYSTWYKPNNAAIILTGNFDKQVTLQEIEKQFAQIKPAVNFPDRAIHHIPALDLSKLKNRRFNVKKGSDYATFIGYMGAENLTIQNQLSMADPIFTLEPSGRLYQKLVKTQQATDVEGGTDLDNQYNFVILGAEFTPQAHQADKVEQTLIQQIESGQKLTDEEVNRVKKMIQNSLSKVESDAVSFGSLLANYVVTTPNGWSKYFEDIQELNKIKANDINQTYQQFFTPDRRLVIEIEPTLETEKKAEQQPVQDHGVLKSTQQFKKEELKDANTYIHEQQALILEAKQATDKIQSKLQQETFKNGFKSIFYPTSLKDGKVYATLNINLGTVQSLWGKQVLLNQLAEILIRGSKKYNLQQVQDKSIEVDGQINSSYHDASIQITISANQQYFTDYLEFVINMLQNPAFDQEDYQVTKAADLASLERSYTEPTTVTNLVLLQQIDHFDSNDIRHELSPQELKQQLQKSDLNQVKQLYKTFLGMNHANIIITGDFDTQKVHQLLRKTLGRWSSKQSYQRVSKPYQTSVGQKIHALAEKREFGSYQAYLAFPVGENHADAEALWVLGQILGGSQLSSRLAYELREQNNLTYSFNHELKMSPFVDHGFWAILANYQPGLADKMSQAVHKTIVDLQTKGVSIQEVESAKAELLKHYTSALSDDRAVHLLLVSQQIKERTLQTTLERYLKIKKINADDINRVVKKYFNLDQLVEVMADQYGASK